MDGLYKLFKGYSKEEIDVAFNKLKKREQEFLMLFYDRKKYPSITMRELCKKCNLSLSGGRSRIRTSVNNMRFILEENND